MSVHEGSSQQSVGFIVFLHEEQWDAVSVETAVGSPYRFRSQTGMSRKSFQQAGSSFLKNMFVQSFDGTNLFFSRIYCKSTLMARPGFSAPRLNLPHIILISAVGELKGSFRKF